MINGLAGAGYLISFGYVFMTLREQRNNFLVLSEIQTGSRWITISSLLAVIAALFQLAPIFLPVVGMALSPLSSIPMVISVLMFADKAAATFLITAALLFLFNVEEAIIFLLATGPLGLAAATAAISRGSSLKKGLLPASLLSFGILLLVFLIGLPGLTSLVSVLNAGALLAIAAFSYLYSLLFMGITRFLQQRIMPLMASKEVKLGPKEKL